MPTLYRITYSRGDHSWLSSETYPSAIEATIAALDKISYIASAFPHWVGLLFEITPTNGEAYET